MKPIVTQIRTAHPSERELVFIIPHSFQGSVMLEGLYIFGFAWILFLANLRVLEPAGNSAVVAGLGVVAIVATGVLGHACWTCFADGVLTLRADQVVWERTWQHWKSTRRLTTLNIDAIQIIPSLWANSRKKTLHGIEIRAGRRYIRFGWYLSWEERYWLSQEAKAFLTAFAPSLQETKAMMMRAEDGDQH
ncbi:MAG: hypothetical protein SH847_02330 [Roseiflexaceae bacterium]|nr:hypothetical protein [Roseiflexaceae bacterium]